MELREWLIILGLVLVATIVIDGFRRLQRQRRVPRLDQAIGENGTDAGSDEDLDEAAREAEVNWELPNGGARVVRAATFERNEAEPIRPSEPKRQERIPDEELKESILNRKSRPSFSDMQHNVKSAMRAGAKRVSESAQRLGNKRDEDARARKDARKESDHREPQLGHEPPTADESSTRDPLVSGMPASAGNAATEAALEPLRISRLTPPHESIGADVESAGDSRESIGSRETMTDAVGAEAAEPATAARNDVVTQHPAVERAKRHHVSAARARETLSHAEEVIVISVFARTEEGFDGADLLNLMLACGLRFSEMGIFHRYEKEADDSELQFSMVNVVKPGVFNLDSIQEIVTPGVTFLMPLPGANDTAAAFEAMLETAMVLVRNLGGELKDENHSVMTAQTIEFARQRVQEFERRHRLHRYQAN
ncbi:cell division protein ZipA [Salinicola rhizosphaerae]|uniref:Cell division protein ZipA n=1 Tax=Salinicola rhizosphaerae TaxID=1443141 RepID=A0ABQ3E654_9GAMM|nr:cell division protein ZipA [Salinicola rhizosphaerae]GHB20747.1 hypothetical protein GCM10009038_19410 [Salinicola rhizosphaerae]